MSQREAVRERERDEGEREASGGTNILSDISGLGPEGGRRGDGHYDPDEDEEEEFQEIVVDEEEEEGSIAEGVEGEGEGSEHTSWPHPSHDASSPHVNHATPQVL